MNAGVVTEPPAISFGAAGILTTGGCPCGSYDAGTEFPGGMSSSWWLICTLLLGVYLSLRGYHSLDGDQAYRLPSASPARARLYEDDRLFAIVDAFNPNRGSLIVLDAVTRPLGLSGGLFLLFTLTFPDLSGRGSTRSRGLARIRAERRLGCGGFTPLGQGREYRDQSSLRSDGPGRLIAFALGWLALAYSLSQPERKLLVPSVRSEWPPGSIHPSGSSSRWSWRRVGSSGPCLVEGWVFAIWRHAGISRYWRWSLCRDWRSTSFAGHR